MNSHSESSSPTQRAAPSLESLKSVAGVVALTALIFLATGPVIDPYDEGVVVTAATEVALGHLPHRDFYANYGPAQFYLLALLFKTFGHSILVERIWGALIKAAAILVTYRLGLRLMPPRWSFVACLSSFIWLSLVANNIWPAWGALLASLASVLLLMPGFESTQSGRRVFLAGLLVAVATLFRYDIGGLMCMAEAAIIIVHGLVGRAPSRPLSVAVKPLLIYICGVAALCLPVAIAYMLAGMTRDFVFDILTFPAHNYARMRGLPFPTALADFIPPFQAKLIVYFPILAVAAALVVFADLARRSRPVDGQDSKTQGLDKSHVLKWQLALITAVTLGLFFKGVVRVSALHMSLAVVPASILFMALCFQIRRNVVALPTRAVLVIVGLFALLPSLGALLFEVLQIGNSAGALGRIASGPPCSNEKAIPRLWCYRLIPGQEQAIGFVRQRSAPGDYLFVGLPQHDRIFENDVMIYFLADLRPATKWYHFDPGLQTTLPIQQEMISDLMRTKPRFVVTDPVFAIEPNDSAKSSGVHALDDFIGAHYRQVATFGDTMVLEAQPAIGEPAPAG